MREWVFGAYLLTHGASGSMICLDCLYGVNITEQTAWPEYSLDIGSPLQLPHKRADGVWAR